MKQHHGNPHRAGGFSLIEVLIALLVLAFGLLGLAMLQTVNLRYTQSANQRTQAIGLASDMLDMMRSNRSQIASYVMHIDDMSGIPLPDGGCTVANGALSAAGNVARWKCEVRQTLGAEASAIVDVTPANVVTVTVGWKEVSTTSATSDGNVELETQL